MTDLECLEPALLARELRAKRHEDLTPEEDAWIEMLDRRGIETPCEHCAGYGVVSYSSTATWRSGRGGQACTSDVCDHCWGSGDEHDHWLDLRKLTTKLREWSRRLGEELRL